jgi:peptidoglycan/xylan/chitin deacetylase (PgdA/CDA1 family)
VTKLLRLILMMAVFAGFFAVAFLGFQVAMRSGGGAMEAASAKPRPDGEAPRALSSIVQDYRRGEELAKAGTAAASDATAATSAGVTVASAAGARAVQTPPPSLKLIREWNTNRKLIALTFDDGPHPTITPQLIDLLKSKNAKATFFLIGPNVEKNPEIAKQIVDAGFEVGNHSWTHPTLSKLSDDKAREELTKTNDAIRQAAGTEVQVMRPPYGAANPKVQQLCDELGMRIICWNIDTNDWARNASAKAMEDIIIKNARDGSIVLMHDRYDRTLEVTASVIDQLSAKGFRFATVSELLGMKAPAATAAVAPVPAVPSAVAETPGPAPTPETALPAPSTAAPAPAAAQPPAAEDPADAPAQHIATQELPAVSGEKITRLPANSPR